MRSRCCDPANDNLSPEQRFQRGEHVLRAFFLRRFTMLMRHALKLGVLLRSLASDSVAAEPIVFGQTLPYSGPTSGWSAIGKVQAAYFKR